MSELYKSNSSGTETSPIIPKVLSGFKPLPKKRHPMLEPQTAVQKDGNGGNGGDDDGNKPPKYSAVDPNLNTNGKLPENIFTAEITSEEVRKDARKRVAQLRDIISLLVNNNMVPVRPEQVKEIQDFCKNSNAKKLLFPNKTGTIPKVK